MTSHLALQIIKIRNLTFKNNDLAILVLKFDFQVLGILGFQLDSGAYELREESVKLLQKKWLRPLFLCQLIICQYKKHVGCLEPGIYSVHLSILNLRDF